MNKKFKVGNTIYQRSPRHRVGKEIGGQIYLHKNYVQNVVPWAAFKLAEALLPNGFEYKCVMYEPKQNAIRFDEAPDFDTAREPMVGHYVNVYLDILETKSGYSKMIWHHKWMWVKDDYQGFDVDEAYQWSKYWTQHIQHPSGSKRIWEQQIENIK